MEQRNGQVCAHCQLRIIRCIMAKRCAAKGWCHSMTAAHECLGGTTVAEPEKKKR